MKNYLKDQGFNILVLLLSFYVVVVVALEMINFWSPAAQDLLDRSDIFICAVFILDWCDGFYKAINRKKYIKKYWIDLLASLPYIQVLRSFRIIRIVRIIRLLRIIKSLKGIIPIFRWLLQTRFRSALSSYLAITLIVYLYCSLGLFNFEAGLNESITSYGDALWVGATTLTTVGYGDLYPITTGGRILAILLVVTGNGLLCLLTAEFAAIFMNNLKQNKL